MAADFFDHQEQNRFELKVGASTAYADYHKDAQTLYIDYVFAPPELRGSGAAGKLMQHIVDFAQEKSLHVEPICGYAASWLKRHRL